MQSITLFDVAVVDGNWGEFGDWSACSAKCGGGRQSRERVCDDPAPSNGGRPCSGAPSEQRSCNTQKCPGK